MSSFRGILFLEADKVKCAKKGDTMAERVLTLVYMLSSATT